ncbi:MAG TPA: PilZ domain-containing protein [Allosphingosinicella sp.]|jgi:hypothetical protein|nr:PilZ domain-containing protein [Allosphingosinicella sp.]
MDTADTIYSLADEPPRSWGLDQDDRARLQAGAVGRGSLREICFLRRITPLGAVLCMETAPAVGEQLDLELLTGDRLRGEVEWVEGSDVGLRFHEAADMFALITRNLVQQPGDGRRMPRIELECPAWLEAGSRREIVTVKNVSGGGARIETRVPLVPHEQVVVTLDGFRPVPGIVRWVQGNVAGIAFAPELPWHELMPWLRRRYRPRVQAPAKAKVTPPSEVGTAPPKEERGEIALNLAARVREGSRRWSIEVESVDTRQIRFISYGAVDPGRLFWITLPGLEGWPARVVEVDGYHVTCVFTQPLHPAVLERVLGARAA